MIAENYLEMACNRLSVVGRIIRKYGDISLADYLKTLVPNPAPSYQSRDDFMDAVFCYVSPLLGETIANHAVSDLRAFPIVLTSNHLGVEYFAQSLQSSILFSLNTITGRTSAKTVPVFSCANIPLDNLTYPQGLLLYHVNLSESDVMPRKLPVFPNSLRRSLVSVSPGFNPEMVRKAESQLSKMISDQQISDTLSTVVQSILRQDYCSDSVTALPSYSQQATLLNSRIWKKLFSKYDTVPDLVCLELEKITTMLLKHDLSDPKSLVRYVLFDTELRRHILERLDGTKGCWKQRVLQQRLTDKTHPLCENCGTVFFWGIDDSGRRIPFYLDADYKKNIVFRGLDDNRNERILKFEPDTIIRELDEKRLIPSLFICFLTLSYARGVVCAGGYFQAEYLPNMQYGLVISLQKSGYSEIARLVSEIPADAYLSGMLAIMRYVEPDCLIPAGTVEIMAGGGITDQDIEKIRSLTVRDAHIAGLFETAPDAVPSDSRPTGWKKELARDCHRLLKGKLALK